MNLLFVCFFPLHAFLWYEGNIPNQKMVNKRIDTCKLQIRSHTKYTEQSRERKKWPKGFRTKAIVLIDSIPFRIRLAEIFFRQTFIHFTRHSVIYVLSFSMSYLHFFFPCVQINVCLRRNQERSLRVWVYFALRFVSLRVFVVVVVVWTKINMAHELVLIYDLQIEMFRSDFGECRCVILPHTHTTACCNARSSTGCTRF